MNVKSTFKYLQQVCRKRISEWVKPVCRHIYQLKYDHLAPENKTILINIDDIEGWYRGNRYDEITFPGQIKGGDWSGKITSREVMLRKSEKHKAILQRYRKNLPWQETDLFKKKYSEQIRNGGKVIGISDLNDVKNYYYSTYDKLFSNIQKHGVLPATGENPDIEPLYVLIYKDGEILYTVDGNHRLSMCMALGIDTIPVRVWRRHTEWKEKKEHILRNYGNGLDHKLHKFLTHPDIISELPLNN